MDNGLAGLDLEFVDLTKVPSTSRDINYFPIDDMKAAFVGLGYAFNRITNFIQDRIHGPSLADQLREAILPTL